MYRKTLEWFLLVLNAVSLKICIIDNIAQQKEGQYPTGITPPHIDMQQINTNENHV